MYNLNLRVYYLIMVERQSFYVKTFCCYFLVLGKYLRELYYRDDNMHFRKAITNKDKGSFINFV